MFGKIQKYVANNKIEVILVILILVIASFYRLYRISDYMTFLGDEGRDVIVARSIIKGDFTLLGPRASAGDFFLGPIYYYMMAPALLLSNYDPVGPAVMVALFGIATVFLIYFVGKKVFGFRAGIIAAALYSISPLVVSYSRSSWNPNPMPFFSLLILFLLYLNSKENKRKVLIFIGFLLGIALQLHYLSTFLGVIIFVYLLLSNFIILRKIQISKLILQYVNILIGFFIGISPFLLFELRHGFPNTITIFKFILGGTGAESMSPNYSFIGNIADVFFRLFGRLITKFPPPEQVNVSENFYLQIWMIGTYILAIASIYFLTRLKNKVKLLFILSWLFLGIFLFGFYKKTIYDYYLGFMFPLPFLLTGNLFSNLLNLKYKKIGLLIASCGFTILLLLNFSGSPFFFIPNKQKEQAKTIADFVLSKTDNKPYNFALLTRGNSDHVYRYFFETANRAPVTLENAIVDPERRSVTKQLLIVCEYTDCQPLGNSLWEIAGFGRASIDGVWDISFVKVYRLVHYQREADFELKNLNINTKYENSELKMTIKYPEEFEIKDNTKSAKKWDEKVYLNLLFVTPEVSSNLKQKKNFDWKRYADNSIKIDLTVKKNESGKSLTNFITDDFKGLGIDGKTSVIQNINQNLVTTQIPKDGAFVYEGNAGGEHPKKIYFFANQNYIFYLTMSNNTDTGILYTQDAEELFDRIAEGIEFK